MAPLTDEDFAQLKRRANASELTAADARKMLAEALLERGARKHAEYELAKERFYHDDKKAFIVRLRERICELVGQRVMLHEKRAAAP
jgi:hypothetical protein